MAGKDNLKPFQKGRSGNPKGKAKGTLNFKTAAERFLSQTTLVVDEDGEPIKMTRLAAIAYKMVKDACSHADPDVRRRAAVALLDRLEGKPIMKVEAQVESEKALYILPGNVELRL